MIVLLNEFLRGVRCNACHKVESIFAITILIIFTMVLGVLDRDQLRAFFVQSFLPSRYQTNALSVASIVYMLAMLLNKTQ
jgi:hypothetical protein